MSSNFFSFLIKKNEPKVSLTGKPGLRIQDILHISQNGSAVQLLLSDENRNAIEACHKCMIEQVEDGVPIYGTNSSFGEQANRLRIGRKKESKIGSAKKISESILFTDVSVGPKLPPQLVRAAMLIRANMLLQGVSAVKQKDAGSRYFCESLFWASQPKQAAKT